jgi:erythromycin esterase
MNPGRMQLRVCGAALVLLCAASQAVSAQEPRPTPRDTSAAVVAWIRQHAIPLRSIDAGHGFADLQPLKRVLQDARIVGLGESAHGAREFFRAKHRIIEFLVKEMGFTAFAMEGAYSDAESINTYIVSGQGERAAALTQLGYVAWDNEDFGALLDWLRAHNATVPDTKKVRFYGLDLFRNEIGRRKVLAFLHRVAPEQENAADSIFRALALEEAKFPFWDTTVVAQLRPRLEALSSALVAKETASGQIAARSEFDAMLQYIRVMQQAARLSGRERPMMENLVYLAEHERPGTKFIVWEHNNHVALDPPEGDDPEAALGYYIRERFGPQYYAMGLEFGRGSSQTRMMAQPGGEFKLAVLADPPEGSIPWHLHQAGIANLILDLRATRRGDLVEHWLSTPHAIHSVNWGYRDETRDWNQQPLARYDGILFVSEITPSRPTANALRMVAERKGF